MYGHRDEHRDGISASVDRIAWGCNMPTRYNGRVDNEVGCIRVDCRQDLVPVMGSRTRILEIGMRGFLSRDRAKGYRRDLRA